YDSVTGMLDINYNNPDFVPGANYYSITVTAGSSYYYSVQSEQNTSLVLHLPTLHKGDLITITTNFNNVQDLVNIYVGYGSTGQQPPLISDPPTGLSWTMEVQGFFTTININWSLSPASQSKHGYYYYFYLKLLNTEVSNEPIIIFDSANIQDLSHTINCQMISDYYTQLNVEFDVAGVTLPKNNFTYGNLPYNSQFAYTTGAITTNPYYCQFSTISPHYNLYSFPPSEPIP
ncbi:MAG TPA: hypothetical protein VFQ86_13085, partial [Arachidicoccus soli]|nr:hypothetical protein [Arachidicoccus soli]